MKYGETIIWGGMVYVIVAFLIVRARTRTVVAVALASELFRLYQTPELDVFRHTLARQLLLGRIFSAWNIVAYAVGIAMAAVFDDWLRRAAAS